jgi:hypothetical protein
MRVLVDDINNTVTTYEHVDAQGQLVEITRSYHRKQPEIEQEGDRVTIKGHPRLGCRVEVTVDGDAFEGVMLEGYGSQDILAQIASKIHFDDTDRTASLDTTPGNEYHLIVSGGTIEDVTTTDFEHEPLPSHVEAILTRHISGYKG